ncbi:PPE family protein [Mycobacterium intracellulare]|uniref:PPE family protein n=2 Tax=Mycobacterium intracellulare TaxID=1767 RepID=A0AAE4RLZ0_MYCIT|nr:PPE family protein [Mycobacterium intracellulare]AFS14653.1 PPE family protein [Mycobacterium intracellulare subsp. intracellulare MTCC 9506]MDV6976303.1 PPE family protein [Mycobacterium intracellulare]MDV6981356.1 PPE family protein [Mycobacterium intracellulare]MDV7015352.1 PPE family protein [Mycobacterium intracellulare]MDV7027590.1 PPE family protein [Mycobacterium intracellulare]
MMLDYGAFPPEFNSSRIYTGPGSGSLMAAASAWSTLAAELNSAALSYEQVVTSLSSEEWLGTASATMAQAVEPYIAWMTTAAAQAEEAAAQARAAAAAYEAALSSSVPPPLVASNRMQSKQLQATNVLGQNTPLIAQLEAQYGEFWAQDAGAMYSYAGQSSSATKQTPFKEAPKITNDSGTANQTTAVTQATSNSTATNTSKILQTMATPGSGGTDPTGGGTTPTATPAASGGGSTSGSLSDLVSAYNPFSSLFYNTEGLPYFSIGMGNNFVQIAKSVGAIGGAAPAAAKALPALGGLGGMLGGGAAAAHPVAALGSAASIGGKLSVPVAWSGAAAAAPALGHAIPVSTISAAPEAAGGPGNLLGGMPLAGAGAGGHGVAGPKYGFRPTVMARPPFAG